MQVNSEGLLLLLQRTAHSKIRSASTWWSILNDVIGHLHVPLNLGCAPIAAGPAILRRGTPVQAFSPLPILSRLFARQHSQPSSFLPHEAQTDFSFNRWRGRRFSVNLCRAQTVPLDENESKQDSGLQMGFLSRF